MLAGVCCDHFHVGACDLSYARVSYPSGSSFKWFKLRGTTHGGCYLCVSSWRLASVTSCKLLLTARSTSSEGMHCRSSSSRTCQGLFQYVNPMTLTSGEGKSFWIRVWHSLHKESSSIWERLEYYSELWHSTPLLARRSTTMFSFL